MYIESSYPSTPGDYATLTYKLRPSTAGGCFSMFYFLYGNSIGSLSVQVSTAERGPIGLWKVGQQDVAGSKWKHVSIDVPIIATEVRTYAK